MKRDKRVNKLLERNNVGEKKIFNLIILFHQYKVKRNNMKTRRSQEEAKNRERKRETIESCA